MSKITTQEYLGWTINESRPMVAPSIRWSVSRDGRRTKFFTDLRDAKRAIREAGDGELVGGRDII